MFPSRHFTRLCSFRIGDSNRSLTVMPSSLAMFTSIPGVSITWPSVRWSWRSITRRSEITITELKTGLPSGVCRVGRLFASHAMQLVLPLPALCWFR